MGLAAAVGAAGAIGGALISATGAQSAANTQAGAANAAAQTQLQMYNQTRSDLQPFMQAGTGALSQLASIFGFGAGGTGQPNAAAATSQLTQFPGYQFGLDQGQQALDRSAASRGLVLSGAQLKDSPTFGNNYATQTAWQPSISELSGISTQGQNAAAGVGTQLAAGQATAAGQVATGNALGQGITQLLSGYGSSYGPSAGGSNYGTYNPAGVPVPSDLQGLV